MVPGSKSDFIVMASAGEREGESLREGGLCELLSVLSEDQRPRHGQTNEISGSSAGER